MHKYLKNKDKLCKYGVAGGLYHRMIAQLLEEGSYKMNFGYRRVVDNVEVMINMAAHEHSKITSAHYF